MKRSNMIRDSLNENLSALYVSQRRHAELIHEITGGKKVKKKLSVGFVLVLVLVLAAAAALAAALWQTVAGDVAAMESRNGYFEAWAAEEKVKLIRLLRENGVLPEDEDVRRILDEGTEETERASLADKVMMDYISGPLDTVTLESVLETMHGPINEWTLEEKVWYNAMLKEHGLLTDEATHYILPATGDATQEEAVMAAKEIFASAFGVSMKTLDQAAIEATFEKTDADLPDAYFPYYKKGDRIWSVILHVNRAGEGEPNYGLYHADLNSRGQVLAYTAVRNGENPIRYLVPQQSDIAKEDAVLKAKAALQSKYALTEEQLSLMNVNAYLWLVDYMPQDGSPYTWNSRVWTVTLRQGDAVAYQADLSGAGDVMMAFAAGE